MAQLPKLKRFCCRGICVLMLALSLAKDRLAAQGPLPPRDAWITSQMVAMQRYKIGEDAPLVTIRKDVMEEPDDAGCTLRYYADQDGLLRFASGDWAWIATHNFHANDGIGDVMLILTSTGKFYVNEGHPCAHMIVRSKVKVLSLVDFLSTLGLGEGIDKVRWKELHAKLPPAKEKRLSSGAK